MHHLDDPITLPARGPVSVSAIDTPFGRLLMATRQGRLVCTSGPRRDSVDPIEWARRSWPELEARNGQRSNRRAVTQLNEYFAGSRRAFDLPLALVGNDLHIHAWLAAIEIPYGKTRTYGDIAWDIGAPGAARAVGRAMSLCELPIIVPCHRVIGSGGRRCGSLEAWEQRCRLLEFEREHGETPRKQRIAVDRRRGDRIAYRGNAFPRASTDGSNDRRA